MKFTRWLIRQSGPRKRFRLFCFCYAGGNANVFTPWQAILGPAIEVCGIQLPGRGIRFAEKPYSSLAPLIEILTELIESESDLPFAFFGHSLGSIIAFELARQCHQRHLPMPRHLFVSGAAAPQDRDTSKRMHELPDDDLISALRDYNGTPPEILEHRELMELLLPTIRADFSLVENYRYCAGSLLNIPITVLEGESDTHVSAEQAQGWQKETINTCEVRWFSGDHFFINNAQDLVLQCISSELSKYMS